MAETAANEFVLLTFWKAGSQVYYGASKIETNATTGVETATSVVAATAVTLPVSASIARESGVLYFFVGGTDVGSTTLTTNSDPTLVGIEADAGTNAAGASGEATFSSVTVWGTPIWTQIPTQLALNVIGGNGDLFASTTPAVQAGTFNAGPMNISVDLGTNGQCGSTPLAYLGYTPEVKDPSHNVTYLGAQGIGPESGSCNPGCWTGAGSSGSGLQQLTLVHGDVYTFLSTTSVNVVGSNGQRGTANVTKTVQLNP
jgi:hypothetical protein